jgi:hypothetical protein
MIPPGSPAKGTLRQGFPRFHRNADQFSISTRCMASPARRSDRYLHRRMRGHVLLIPQGIPIVVPAVTNGQDATGQVLSQMFRDGFRRVQCNRCSAVFGEWKVPSNRTSPGEHGCRSVPEIPCNPTGPQWQSLRVRIIGIRNPLDPAHVDGDNPIFEGRVSRPVDKPSDMVADRR